MINYLIVAYESKIDETSLSNATEIYVYADNTADALKKAKAMFMAKNYMVRKVSELAPRDMYPNAMMAYIDHVFNKTYINNK